MGLNGGHMLLVHDVHVVPQTAGMVDCLVAEGRRTVRHQATSGGGHQHLVGARAKVDSERHWRLIHLMDVWWPVVSGLPFPLSN